MKSNRQVIKALLLVTQIGISMMTPIFLSTFLGYLLDRWFKTGFWMIVFLILGILAAFRNIYHLTKSFYAKDLERENKELKYFEELRKHSKEIEDNKIKNKK